MSTIVGLVAEPQQRRLQIGLDVDLVHLGRARATHATGDALLVLDQQHAAGGFPPRPRGNAAGHAADLGTGRHAQQHLVVQRLEPRQVLHPGDERDVVDRLGEEIVGAGFEPLHLVGGLVQRA